MKEIIYKTAFLLMFIILIAINMSYSYDDTVKRENYTNTDKYTNTIAKPMSNTSTPSYNNTKLEIVLNTSNQNLCVGEECNITMEMQKANGIVALGGELEYDKNILEKIEIQEENGWSIENGYNEANRKFVIDNGEFQTGNTKMLNLKFKVKEGIEVGTQTTVKVKNIVCSDAINDIPVSDSSIDLNIIQDEAPYIISRSYEIQDEAKIISRIPSDTTFAEFTKNVETNKQIAIFDKKGNVISDTDIIGTEMTLQLDGEENYVLIVTGDLDGNGKITITDLAKLKLHCIEKEILSGNLLISADLNNDKKISVTDIAQIKMVLIK